MKNDPTVNSKKKQQTTKSMRGTNRRTLAHVSVQAWCTYCSPAFWPQIRSEGSVGSAAPSGEEAEEPQTLETATRSGRRGAVSGGGGGEAGGWRRQEGATQEEDGGKEGSKGEDRRSW